jgi:hypothetical protein
MKALPLNAEHLALPSDLLVRCPLALEQVEAQLFILALGCLNQDSQRLTFEIAFKDILPEGSVDNQYTRLEKAQQRLTQPLKYETLRLGKRSSHYIPLFTDMSIDQDTGLVTGVFNDHLRHYLLDLADEYTTTKLEALLMHR